MGNKNHREIDIFIMSYHGNILFAWLITVSHLPKFQLFIAVYRKAVDLRTLYSKTVFHVLISSGLLFACIVAFFYFDLGGSLATFTEK